MSFRVYLVFICQQKLNSSIPALMLIRVQPIICTRRFLQYCDDCIISVVLKTTAHIYPWYYSVIFSLPLSLLPPVFSPFIYSLFNRNRTRTAGKAIHILPISGIACVWFVCFPWRSFYDNNFGYWHSSRYLCTTSSLRCHCILKLIGYLIFKIKFQRANWNVCFLGHDSAFIFGKE